LFNNFPDLLKNIKSRFSLRHYYFTIDVFAMISVMTSLYL